MLQTTLGHGLKSNVGILRWPPIGKGFSKGAITLAGDAAHPMTPNLGQGGCTALEVDTPNDTWLACTMSIGLSSLCFVYAALI